METEEIWKPIKGYEGLYEISNLGRVKNLRNNKLLKNFIQSDRHIYNSVTLRKNNIGRNIAVHVLLVESFFNVKPVLLFFKDSDGTNSNLNNISFLSNVKCNICGKTRDRSKCTVTTTTEYICDPCYNSQYLKKYYKENAEKIIKKVKEWANDNLKGTEKGRIKSNQATLKSISTLSDGYVRSRIKQNTLRKDQLVIPTNEIASDLIQIQRNIIKIKRLCKILHAQNAVQ